VLDNINVHLNTLQDIYDFQLKGWIASKKANHYIEALGAVELNDEQMTLLFVIV